MVKTLTKENEKDHIATRQLVRQKSKKQEEYNQKQEDKETVFHKSIEVEADKIEKEIEISINGEADRIEEELNETFEKEADEIESQIKSNQSQNG